LTEILRRSPSVVEIDGQSLINFTRCIEVTAWMKDIVQYDAPKLPWNPGKLVYLQNQLRDTSIHKNSADGLDERSRFLEAAETSTKARRNGWQRIVYSRMSNIS
jgi:hypothetical protein